MSLQRIDDFALERYFARWEFAVDHQLSASDVEPLRLRELLALADSDARERWEALSLGYTESTGLPALREAIAGMYPGLGPEHVFVLAGAEEGIFLTLHTLLGPGDEAVVVTPAYQSLVAVPAAIGAHVKRVALRAEQDWTLDLDDLARAVTRRTKVVVVNFPHNPTGAHVPPAVQRAIIELAGSVGATLLSDEVYQGLEHSAAALPPAAQLAPNAVSLGVVSKSYALAGLRIGWLATRNTALLQRVARLRDYTTICSSSPSEVLALVAIRARAKLLERSLAIVTENLRRARDFVGRMSRDVSWVPPLAGSTALPRFASRNADDVSARLATRDRVLMLPGSVFGTDPSYFRLGLGRRDFPDALKALERLLVTGG